MQGDTVNAIVRAVRTYLQVLVGLVIAGWADVDGLSSAIDLGEAALIASIPAALALVQNLLEDTTPVSLPK
jgi:hypothetical protein